MKQALRLLVVAAIVAVPAFAQERTRGGTRGERFERNGPKPGERAPDFTLQTIDGGTVRGSELWKEKPALLMTGSYTCPVFRERLGGFERLAREFRGQVNFLVIYTTEAHPKGDPSPYSGREWVTPANEKDGVLHPQPATPEQRLALAKKCAAALKIGAPLAVDTIDDTTWKAYGSAPNCAYLVGPGGKVAAQHGWFDLATMERSIRVLLDRAR